MRQFMPRAALILGSVAAAMAGSAVAFDARAANIQIAPVRVVLQPGRPVASLVVTNDGDSEISMQAEVMSWAQKDRQDVYAPTREVLVNPAIFRIPANGRQIVRLGLQVPALADERSYRIFLKQLPRDKALPSGGDAATAGAGAQLQTLLQLVLPIFVPPSSPAGAPSVAWRLSAPDAGTQPATSVPALTIDNLGREHLQITQVTVRHADGRELLRQRMSVYVLPQQSARLPVALPSLPPDTRLQFEAQADSEVPLPPVFLQVPGAAAATATR
ncbi:MAG TPA: fimbria/pilus periplasmic chaperone [Variovorax sp.]